jgi:hypothetical protein
MLTDAELAIIRAGSLAMLPDTCNLLAVSRVSDGMGGFDDTWGTAGTAIACRLDPLKGSEQAAGAALKPYHAYTLTLPYGTTITPAYQIEHGGFNYSVTSVDNDKSWAASVRAVVERL